MDFEKTPTPDELDKLLDDELDVRMDYMPDISDAALKRQGNVDTFPLGIEVFDKAMEGGITDHIWSLSELLAA